MNFWALLGAFVVALAVVTTGAVPFARSSFMQVEPQGTQCAFNYFGILPNGTVYRSGRITWNFWNLVEADRVRNGSSSTIIVEKSTRYWLDSSLPQYVASSTIFERVREEAAVSRRELVQMFNLTNGASVVVINSFFNASTTLVFATWQGNRTVDVTPLLAKMTIGLYNWPWVNKSENKIELEFGLTFDIFQELTGDADSTTTSTLPQISGNEDDSPLPSFTIKGRLSDLEYEVSLLKFGIDGNSSEIDMHLDARSAIYGLASFFATSPPVLKFNMTMRIDPFHENVEYDPNFLILLGDTPSGAPDDSPVSAIVSASLDPGIVAAIVVVIVIVISVIISIVVLTQRRKFNAKVRVNAPSFETKQDPSDSAALNPKPATQLPAEQHSRPGRWRAFSTEDVRDNRLRNTEGQ